MERRKLNIGAHVSISGGIYKSVSRAIGIGCEVMQIFVKSNAQWKARKFTKGEIEKFKVELKRADIHPVIVHSSYLINLCSADREVLNKSRVAFIDELKRCESIGADYFVFHPGAHLGKGLDYGIKLTAESLNIIHEKTKGFKTLSVIEVTAGQGSTIGYRFEQIAKIIELVEDKKRVGVCIDTCHIFSAGYDIRSEKGCEKTFSEFDAIVGIEKIKVFHLNDSMREFNSRVDRHYHIGKGFIGKEAFAYIMRNPIFTLIPKIIETPKGNDDRFDLMNLKTLRKLALL
jgi:deoxyribonuclease-4